MIIVEKETKSVTFSGEDVKGLVDVCEFARRYALTQESKETYGLAHVGEVCSFIGTTFARCKE